MNWLFVVYFNDDIRHIFKRDTYTFWGMKWQEWIAQKWYSSCAVDYNLGDTSQLDSCEMRLRGMSKHARCANSWMEQRGLMYSSATSQIGTMMITIMAMEFVLLQSIEGNVFLGLRRSFQWKWQCWHTGRGEQITIIDHCGDLWGIIHGISLVMSWFTVQ